jgi:hypothetical protein
LAGFAFAATGAISADFGAVADRGVDVLGRTSDVGSVNVICSGAALDVVGFDVWAVDRDAGFVAGAAAARGELLGASAFGGAGVDLGFSARFVGAFGAGATASTVAFVRVVFFGSGAGAVTDGCAARDVDFGDLNAGRAGVDGASSAVGLASTFPAGSR